MIRRVLLVLALLLPLPAAAQTIEGSWALEVEGTAIFRFDIEPAAREGEWRATWSRPSSFASDGNRFAKLTGPPEQVRSSAGLEIGEAVELSFDDPRPGAIPDIFRFDLVGPNAVRMTYVGTDLAPYTLTRTSPGAPLGPWDADRVYVRPVPAEQAQGPGELPPSQSADSFKLPSSR